MRRQRIRFIKSQFRANKVAGMIPKRHVSSGDEKVSSSMNDDSSFKNKSVISGLDQDQS